MDFNAWREECKSQEIQTEKAGYVVEETDTVQFKTKRNKSNILLGGR
jgi:hypothetical protein